MLSFSFYSGASFRAKLINVCSFVREIYTRFLLFLTEVLATIACVFFHLVVQLLIWYA